MKFFFSLERRQMSVTTMTTDILTVPHSVSLSYHSLSHEEQRKLSREFHDWCQENKVAAEHLDVDGDFYFSDSLPFSQEERKQMLTDLQNKNMTRFTPEVMEIIRGCVSHSDGYPSAKCFYYWICYVQHGENHIATVKYLLDQEETSAIGWRWTNPWTYNRKKNDERVQNFKEQFPNPVERHFAHFQDEVNSGEIPDECLIYMIRQHASKYEMTDVQKYLRLHEVANEGARTCVDDIPYTLELDIESWKHPSGWWSKDGFWKMFFEYQDKVAAFVKQWAETDLGVPSSTPITRQHIFGGIVANHNVFFSTYHYRGNEELLIKLKQLPTEKERIALMKRHQPNFKDYECSSNLKKITHLLE